MPKTMNNKKSLHKERAIFDVALKQLKKLESKKEKGTLTEEEDRLIGYLLDQLWNTVYLYGLNLAHSMLSSYPMTPAAYEEVQSDLYIAFVENLYNYQPSYTRKDENGNEVTTDIAPTTYYKPYFRGAIRKYILSKFHRVTQYDANNIRKVKKAMQFYESLGVKHTPHLLSHRTGLTVKVVEQTLQVIIRSQNVDLDDLHNISGSMPSPEAVYMEKDRYNSVYNTIRSKLSDDEFELFIAWVNPDGATETPYEKLATMTGRDSADIRAELNRIIIRLAGDPEMNELKGKTKRIRRKTFDTSLHIKEENTNPLESVRMRQN